MPRITYRDLNFTADRAAKIETANTIISEYHRQGYTLTLRQLYYQFVARGLIENTERSYKNLGSIVSDGREAGLIDWFAIEDRGRNCSSVYVQEDEQQCLDGIEYHFSLDYWERQNAYVEVWVEKEALAAVVQRPADRWRVPFMACKGYLSASEAWRAGQRFERKEAEGRDRLVVIHLGDHDPSGIDMSRDNSARLQLFSNHSRVELHRIALNMDQVEAYNPPPNPAKVTDSRAADYIARFGTTSWELDALEPKVLDRLIGDKIKEFVDMDQWSETEAEETEGRQLLSRLHAHWPEVREYVEGLSE